MVEKLDKKSDGDKEVEIVPSTEQSIELSDEEADEDICEEEHLRKLFIGGLSGQTTEERLRQYYKKWGTVVDTVVMRDAATKRSRGFGFVTFAKAASVDKAQAKRPHVIDGKTVESKRALPRPQNPPAEVKKTQTVKKLFVGGIKEHHDEECLNEYFSEFGKVISAKILTDNITGKRRGFALIEFDDYDSVDKAILKKIHLVKNELLDVKKSVYCPESEKKAADKKKNDFNKTNNVPPGPSQANRRMPSGGPLIPPNSAHYQGPSSNQHSAQQYHQMPINRMPGPRPPPSNQWGSTPPNPIPPTPPYAHTSNSYPQQPPPVTAPQQPTPTMAPNNYSGYSQGPPLVQPPTPQNGNWNNYYQGAGGPNNWNSAPPPPPQPPMTAQPSAPNWQNNQWGPTPVPPAAGLPPRPMPAANVAPQANWQQPNGPPQRHPAPGMYQQQNSVPPPPQSANNFGSGYQQSYGGGPTKHSNIHANRMNPYGAPPNHYNGNNYENTQNNGNRYRR